MRRNVLTISLIVMLSSVSLANAGTLWNAQITASAEGYAHILDGGPVVFDSESTTPGGPLDINSLLGGPDDSTLTLGVLGADYSTSWRALFAPGAGGELSLVMDFSTGYTSSSLLDGARPGGEGGGTIEAVAEFVMPTDELAWSFLFESRIPNTRFNGSAFGRAENVTQGTVLFERFAPFGQSMSVGTADAVISGRAGDLIRITYRSEGFGSVDPGVVSFDSYTSTFFNRFIPIIPEPSTLAMLLMGGWLIGLRGRNKNPRRAGKDGQMKQLHMP